ncbi:MAG: hypothetical protein IJ060_13090 [Oscillospiraceae bacterium]|nr:hypothetical protein [Oscillospiraceae bacterium]
MERSGPMWWMRGSSGGRENRAPGPPAPPPPPLPPEPEPAPRPQQSPVLPFHSSLRSLTEQLRNADGETLLLLGLIRLLYQDHADSKLLLALAYILL